MPFRLNTDDTRADTLSTPGSMDGARAVCGELTVSSSVGTFEPLERAYKTYEEIAADAADQGVHEEQDHDYAAATFAGIHEAVAKKGGGVPIGCFQCEQPRPRYIAGSIWMRHDGDRHYLVFMDASGNCTEYRIWFCPFCGKKL